MEQIHFDNLGEKKYWIFIIILALIFTFIKEIPFPFEFENSKFYPYISSFGLFLLFLFWSRLFWYKNSVLWNKKGIMLRIKSFLGKSFRFDEIESSELKGETMILIKTDGEKIQIDLSEIAEVDIQKLREIIIKNTIANNKKNNYSVLNLDKENSEFTTSDFL